MEKNNVRRADIQIKQGCKGVVENLNNKLQFTT